MKAAADKKTGDLLPDNDLAGERPRKLTQREKVAVRVARMRETKGLRGLTLNLPAALVEKFHAKRKKQGKTANEVIAKLLETQYQRDR